MTEQFFNATTPEDSVFFVSEYQFDQFFVTSDPTESLIFVSDGSQGPQGVPGQPGLPGIDGLDGEEGSQGIPGPTGATGATGTQGSMGPPGMDGLDGEDSFTWPLMIGGVSTPLPIVTVVPFSTTMTVDLTTTDVVDITLTASTGTINFINGNDGQAVRVRLRQDTTGGRTVTWGTMVRFGSDIASFVPSTAPNALDHIGFFKDAAAGKFDLVAFARGY